MRLVDKDTYNEITDSTARPKVGDNVVISDDEFCCYLTGAVTEKDGRIYIHAGSRTPIEIFWCEAQGRWEADYDYKNAR